MTRNLIIAANWKMNMLYQEVVYFLDRFNSRYRHEDRLQVVICPPFVWLQMIYSRLPWGVALGAQNISPEEKGAFTGEISAAMLKDVGCRFAIVGHSERRILMGEDDSVVHAKIARTITSGLIPILCVGEKEEERQQGKAEATVVAQLRHDLAGIPLNGDDLVVAYEPVWAIGTGRTASAADAEEMCSVIRGHIRETYGDRVADKIRILYGGSVTPDNAGEIMAQQDVDGALVGGASLDADKFAAIIEAGRRGR